MLTLTAMRSRRLVRFRWTVSLLATALAAATLCVVWLIAVPYGPVVCPAIHPAPANCMAEARSAGGAVVTMIALALFAATLVAALTLRERHRAIVIAGVTLLAVAPIAACVIVAWMPFG